jgi:hypothetical protein
MRSLAINGWPIETLGLRLVNISPWLAGAQLTRAVVAMPGYSGGVPSPFATVTSRILTLESIVQPTSMAHRLQLLDQYADALDGLLEIESVDAPDRVLYGTYQANGVEVSVPRFVEVQAALRTEILCADGAKYDREPSAIALSTTPTPIPLGTAASVGLFRFRGAAAGVRRVLYRGINGNVLGAIGVNMTIGSSECVDVDGVQRGISLCDASGVFTNAYPFKLPSDRWFALHRTDGHPAADAWPTLELDGGTGVFYYRRAWSN